MEEITSKSVLDANGHVAMCTRVRKENGTVIARTLSIPQYVQLFEKNAFREDKDVFFHVEKERPVNYHDSWISKKGWKCVMDIPAGKHGFTYMDIRNYHVIPFPRLLYFVFSLEGRVRETHMFAVKGNKPITKSTVLYAYPFGNVQVSGHVCMGNIPLPKNCDMRETCESLQKAFFDGITNNDYFSEDRNTSKIDQKELIRRLDDLEVFPENELTESGFTYGEFMKKFL